MTTNKIEYLNPNKPDPPQLIRWGVLIFVSLAMFGNYYIYDSIAPIAKMLEEQLGFSNADIGTMNAVYSIPNFVMVLIGGIVIDKLGTRLSSLIFAVLCLIGAIVTAATGDLYVMLAGRFIFGLGAESLIVAVTTVLGRWFKGKQLSFAFGLNLTIARLGSFAADNSPFWGEFFYNNWQTPLIVAIIPGVISVLSVIIYWGMDVHAAKNYRIRPVPKQDEINFKQIFSFTRSYWFVVLLCVTFYSAIFPFRTFAIKLFQDVHGMSNASAGNLSSILIFSSMVLTPLFGLLADYVGKRSLLMMIGSIIIMPVYLMLVYTDLHPSIPMVMMGLAFSLIPAVMWPAVAIIVDESRLGTAYGLMTMVQQVGVALMNFLIGWANDFSGGYEMGMWIFSTLGFFGLFFAFMLRRSEMAPGNHGLEEGIRDTKNG